MTFVFSQNSVSIINNADTGFFSLQDAAGWAGSWTDWGHYEAIFRLFESGCRLANGTRDCTTACSSSGPEIFGDGVVNPNAMYTLQNCLVYPNISDLLSTDSLTDDARQVALDFGIVARNETNISAIYSPVRQCFQDFCSTNHSYCGDFWNQNNAWDWDNSSEIPYVG